MELRWLVFVMILAMFVACNESILVSNTNQGEKDRERGNYSWVRWAMEHVQGVFGLKQSLDIDIADVTKPARQIIKGIISLEGKASKAIKKATEKGEEAIEKAHDDTTTEEATIDRASSLLKDTAVEGIQTMKSKAEEYSTDASNMASKVKDIAEKQAETIAESAKIIKNKAQKQTEGVLEKASRIKEHAQQEAKLAAQKAQDAKETMDHKVEDAKESVEEHSSWVKEKANEGYNAAKKAASNTLRSVKERMKKKAKEKASEMKERAKEMTATRYSDVAADDEL